MNQFRLSQQAMSHLIKLFAFLRRQSLAKLKFVTNEPYLWIATKGVQGVVNIYTGVWGGGMDGGYEITLTTNMGLQNANVGE